MILSETENVYSDEKNFSRIQQQVMNECKEFFLGGRETTSFLLSWAILLLAHNQGWQENAHQGFRMQKLKTVKK
ncbi:hypothetical protein SUGI_0554410 [Cryptomeria japonica]|nr:hypothetical protein SUGI_0554410 [Cryptomeria japonica]